MLSDTDYDLLDKRLKAIEDSLEMLKAMFPVQDRKLEPDVDYVLYQGSLTDAGAVQIWNSNHKLVDCISTIKLEE
jgi:hypothetical protein